MKKTISSPDFAKFFGTILLTAVASFYVGSCFFGDVSAATAQDRRGPTIAAASTSAPASVAAGSQRSFEERLRELAPEERTAVQVYEKCNRGTANVDTKIVRSSFFAGRTEVEAGGSAVVLDKQGHILTNFHVVEGARSVQITLFNGKSYAAEVVGVDPQTDIAVVKIDAPQNELFPIEIVDSSSLLVGQKVFAIGNPFGLERTLTSGIISSLNRTISSRVQDRLIRQVIQIDAAINVGNSGGPLLDSKGRMIGLNTAIASRVGENSGVGFSIPSNTVLRIVPILISKGKVARGEIGISVYETPEGLMVREVLPGSSAERAGLKGPELVEEQSNRGAFRVIRRYTDTSTADTILAVNDRPVKTAEDFYAMIEEHKNGDRVNITVQRKGQTQKIPVTLEENRPAEKRPYRGI